MTPEETTSHLTDVRLAKLADRLSLEETFRRSDVRGLQEQIDTLNGICNDINERLDELTGLVSALQVRAVEGVYPEPTPNEEAALDDGWIPMDTGAPVAGPADVMITGSGPGGSVSRVEVDLSPEERISLDELAERMGMGPVDDGEVCQRADALRAVYHGPGSTGRWMAAWNRVARESMRMEEEAVNRAVDQTVDHCKEIRRLKAEIARLEAELDAKAVGESIDPVPMVRVTDALYIAGRQLCPCCNTQWRLMLCRFCAHNFPSHTECDDCGGKFWVEEEPIPSHFELREDFR